jgi:hypothetical protein
MAPADPGIDPRYAPHFQRGFDPARHAPPPVRSGPVRLEGGPPPTAARVPDPPRMTVTPQTRETVDDIEPELPEPEPTPLARRWWDWLLPGLGAALIVIALVQLWSFGTDGGQFYGSPATDAWHLFFQQARYQLPGPLLIAGTVAVVAGVVLHAVRPRR